jgi:hypothetical protein
MKDTLPCLQLTSAINNLRDQVKAEPYVSPATRTATLQALQALEDTLVDEVQFHVEDLLWCKNKWEESISLKVHYVHGRNSSYSGDQNLLLDLGFGVHHYKNKGREGHTIAMATGELSALLHRFELFDETPANLLSEIHNKLVREVVSISKDGVIKDRPRVFATMEECQELIIDALLKLKLVQPIREVETMHEVYDYNK